MPNVENVTKYNVAIADKDGNVSTAEYISEDKYNELVKAAGTEGAVQVTKVQTFVITEAESLEEAASLFPKRALEFLNYGARLAQQNVQRDFMRDADWAGQEGAFDLLPEIQEPKERKKMSPQEKLVSLLQRQSKAAGLDLSADKINEILAQFGVVAQSAA